MPLFVCDKSCLKMENHQWFLVVCYTNVDIQLNHSPFSFCSTFSSFLTFHFRCLELCVCCYTCGPGWLTKWSLCGPEAGPVCLASLMSTAARLNVMLTFSHINVAEELSACMHYSYTLIYIHTKKNMHTGPTSQDCSESTKTDTETNQKVVYCIVCPHIRQQSHLQTTLCTQRGTPPHRSP